MTGLIPDTPAPRLEPISNLFGAVFSLPEEFTDYLSLALLDSTKPAHEDRYWQGGTNSCVGFDLMQQIHVDSQIHGLRAIDVSPLWAYYAGRKRTADGGEIADLGSRPSDVWMGIEEQGVVSLSRWPFDRAKVNDEPPWGTVTQATDSARWIRHYRIWPGTEPELAVKGALYQARKSVGIGIQLDDTFFQINTWEPWRKTGAWVGSHQVTALGWVRGGLVCSSPYRRGAIPWGVGKLFVLDWSELRSPTFLGGVVAVVDWSRWPR